MGVWVSLVLLLALAGRSNALYCICKDGLSDQALQKTIDYACGSGADCSAIIQNGACYQPNTVKNHCDYAANSYYQRKSSTGATCDFSGTATTSSTVPAAAAAVSGCVYQSTAGSSSTSTTTANSPPTSTSTSTSPVYGGAGLAPTGINDSSAAMRVIRGLTLAAFLAFSGSMLL